MPGAQAAKAQLLISRTCQKYDTDARIVLVDPAGRLDAVHLRHHEIHYHHVRAVEERQLHGLTAGGRLRDHGDVGALQGVSYQATDQGIVIRDDGPQHWLFGVVVLVNH